MRIVLGRGKKRQEWEVSTKDYQTKPNAVIALLEYCGIKALPRYHREG